MTESRFLVVRNDEEQYSIWAADRDLPAGWYDAGFAGTREECLAHVDLVWTDMRPRSVREAAAASAPAPSAAPASSTGTPSVTEGR